MITVNIMSHMSHTYIYSGQAEAFIPSLRRVVKPGEEVETEEYLDGPLFEKKKENKKNVNNSKNK